MITVEDFFFVPVTYSETLDNLKVKLSKLFFTFLNDNFNSFTPKKRLVRCS